jgi:hypothetical protein
MLQEASKRESKRYRSKAEPRPKRDDNDRDADCAHGAGENCAPMNARGRTLDGGLGNDNFGANHFCCLSKFVRSKQAWKSKVSKAAKRFAGGVPLTFVDLESRQKKKPRG